MPDIGYINGEFKDIKDCSVSILDRGFYFADGVYEVCTAYDGRIVKCSKHIQRLRRSLHEIRIPLDISDDAIKKILQEALNRSCYKNAKLYFQVTRGVAPRSHAFPPDIKPTFIATVTQVTPIDPRMREEGVRAITVSDIRWGRCDIKSICLLPNILMKQKAVDAGCYEAIFVSPENDVREGTSSNIFICKNKTLLTHPKDKHVLPGITREAIITLAKREGIKTQEERFKREEMYKADEVFLTVSTAEILPILEIDNKRISDGKPGPLTEKLYNLYQKHKW